MGMDINGRQPSAEVGAYFRANVWSWRPIHHLIIELCSDLLDEETLVGMAYNDGAGPDDQETCQLMADRFEQWLEHNHHGLDLESELQVTSDGHFVSQEELAKNPGLQTESPYKVEPTDLKEWVRFLRHCGGFEVW